MGEGSVARGGNDCCSIVWFLRVLANSHLSWCTFPQLPDQGGGKGKVWLPDQGGGEGKVWLPDHGGEELAVTLPDQDGEQEVWLPDIKGGTAGAWLPDHWLEGGSWLPKSPLSSPSSLSTRRTTFTSLLGGSGVLKDCLAMWFELLCRSLSCCHACKRPKLRASEAGLLFFSF